MGFLTVVECSLNQDMPQSDRNVFYVRNFAGFTQAELAAEIGVDEIEIKAAESGGCALTDDEWRKVLEVCGRRAFDSEDAA